MRSIALDHPLAHVLVDAALVVEGPVLAAGVEDAGRPAVRILDNDVGDPLARAGEFGIASRPHGSSSTMRCGRRRSEPSSTKR